METRFWTCPVCAEERLFVQPTCADGHTADGGECPEWACAECGAAVWSGEHRSAPPEPLHRAA